MRQISLCWVIAGLLSGPLFVSSARAEEPKGPVERSVVTTDGAMYRGEVLEYIIGDHITLKLDSGESKRIVWNDAAQISPPRSKGEKNSGANANPPPSRPPEATSRPDPPPPPPVQPKFDPNATPRTETAADGSPVNRTVVTKDGVTYHGQVVEYEAGSHVLLKLANGEKQRIPWGDAKRMSPPRTQLDATPGPYSPERTIILRDGTTLRGELVESVITDHTTLRLQNGQIRRVAWSEAKKILMPRPAGTPATIPTTGELLVNVDNGSRIQGEFFEHVPDDYLVLRHASGRFRVIPVGTIKSIVLLGESGAN